MKSVVIIFFAVIWAFIASAQDEEIKRSSNVEKAADRLLREIRREIKSLPNHKWAGEYYRGDGLGVNVSLSLSPRMGYVFEWHGCLGLYDRNYGAVTWTNSRINLSFTYENEQKGFQGIAREFIPVQWGKRTYLVPSDDVVGFCNAVNSGAEPRNRLHGRYLLRRGDEKFKVSGKPAVPSEDSAYLLRSPIEAKITEIAPSTIRTYPSGSKFRETRVIISAGKKEGLLPGMELFITSPDIVESFTTEVVRENESEGIVEQLDENDPLQPVVGWKVSTLARWWAVENRLGQ